MHITAPSSHSLISCREVVGRTSLSRTTLWRLVRSGSFPRSIRISPGRVAWSASAVNEWIAMHAEVQS